MKKRELAGAVWGLHIGGERNGAALTQGMGNREEQDLASEKLYPPCCLSQAGFLALSTLAGTAGCSVYLTKTDLSPSAF